MTGSDRPAVVLTIDDEPMVRESFAAYLEDSGFVVLQAENGNKGLELFRRERPDLVLVDLRMPEMDGLEVLAVLAREAPDTPAIVVSGTGVLTDAIEAVRRGAWDYLLKPVQDMADLEHRVRKALERARLIKENRHYRERLEETIQERTAELTRRTRELTEAERIRRFIIDNTAEGFVTSTADFRVQDVNRSLCRMLGYEPDELLGAPIATMVMEESLPDLEAQYALVDSTDQRSYELILRKKNGEPLHVIVNATTMPDPSFQPFHSFAFVTDITESKKTEERIRSSLKEKEILLKEIHHRVKNNLQIISSLLNLQSAYIHDSRDVEIFRECQNRVRSMALLHERLYQSADLARIDFLEYTRNLTTYLLQAYSVDPGRIRLSLDIQDAFLGIDLAIPCGLIINELVSNSIKHAFQASSGSISVSLRPDKAGLYELEVADTGRGLGAIDFRNTSTLGLRLVITLVEQIRGVISLDQTGGTRFTILFPG